MHPQRMKEDLGRSITARSPLLVIFAIVILFMPIPLSFKGWLLIWAFARFVYHSFEPLAQIERHFLFTLLLEGCSIAIIVLPVLMAGTVTLEKLVILYTISMTMRAFAFALFYRNRVIISFTGLQFLKDSFPFLLLTFSAMLQQRMDLYSVAYFLGEEDTAVYQVYINFLIFCQFASGLLLSPYAKNIFRLPARSFLKLERQFMMAGFVFSFAGIVIVWIAVTGIYHFELSLRMYIMGYLYILMFYLYLLRNYELGKLYKQTLAAKYAFLSSFVCLGFSVFLTPRYGVEGALLAVLLAQVLLVLLYQKDQILSYARG